MAVKNSKGKVTREKIVDAALQLASTHPWHEISLNDIANDLKASLADIFEVIEDKDDILIAYGRQIDRKVLENLPEFGKDDSQKDILFDILMERFDLLSEDRNALLSILNSFKSDPKQLLMSGPHLCKSMTWMAEAAGVETNGWRGAALVTGLTGVYLNTSRVWMKDESPDMGKTMATLDKSLTQFHDLLNWLSTKSKGQEIHAASER